MTPTGCDLLMMYLVVLLIESKVHTHKIQTLSAFSYQVFTVSDQNNIVVAPLPGCIMPPKIY